MIGLDTHVLVRYFAQADAVQSKLVHGSRAARQDPAEPYDASWASNKALVLEAERLGYDSVLVAQHTVNPHDPAIDQVSNRGLFDTNVATPMGFAREDKAVIGEFGFLD